MNDDPMTDLIHTRIPQAQAEMNRILQSSLYADGPYKPLPPSTMRERLSDLSWRIQCAWLVLRGKADIG